MGDNRPLVTRENIGCGSVILIALAVWFVVSQSNQDVEKELRALRAEVAELRALIEQRQPTPPAAQPAPAPEQPTPEQPTPAQPEPEVPAEAAPAAGTDVEAP